MKKTSRTPLSHRLWPKDPEKTLRLYGELHDGLSDMVEGGRLDEGDIPDDYQWLVHMLIKLGAQWGIHPRDLEAPAPEPRRGISAMEERQHRYHNR